MSLGLARLINVCKWLTAYWNYSRIKLAKIKIERRFIVGKFRLEFERKLAFIGAFTVGSPMMLFTVFIAPFWPKKKEKLRENLFN